MGLYMFDGELALFKLRPSLWSSRKPIYLNIPYQVSLSFDEDDVTPVDTFTHSRGISVVGKWFHPSTSAGLTAQSLKMLFNDLHPSLKEICGDITILPDYGALLSSIIASNNSLFRVSDASLKDGTATHTWILSSGDVNDIENPLLNILGAGPIHGVLHFLSSSRGELQGITALTIITKLFLEYFSNKCKTLFMCDNMGITTRL